MADRSLNFSSAAFLEQFGETPMKMAYIVVEFHDYKFQRIVEVFDNHDAAHDMASWLSEDAPHCIMYAVVSQDRFPASRANKPFSYTPKLQFPWS
jgi:hypothetical protein